MKTLGLLSLGILLMTLTPTRADTPKIVASGLAFPEGPALAPDGRTLYIVNVQKSFISRLDLKTKKLTREWTTLPDGGRGNGATIGPDGQLYVADVGAKRIVRVSPQGKATTVCDKNESGGALRGPNDLVFDKQGRILFTDPEGSSDTPIGAVYRVTPKTGTVEKIAGELRFPNGLVLADGELTLYVAQSPLNEVTGIDLTPNGIVPPGRKTRFAAVPGPDGMRLGRGGFLYAACFGAGIVAKVAPTGEIVKRYPAGGKNPTNLCFSRDGKWMYVTETETNTVRQIRL